VCSVVAPVADERVAHAVEEFHCGRNVQVVKVPISSGSNTDFQLPHTDLDASQQMLGCSVYGCHATE